MAKYSFQEVMKCYKSMCNYYRDTYGCDHCPIYQAQEEGTFCSDFVIGHCKKFEDIVIKWSEEHPEPTYPTWEE